jgi:hypothetical protein
MTVLEFRDRIIDEAIASVHKHETREHRKRGCLKGLEVCRTLIRLDEYQKEIAVRRGVEMSAATSRHAMTPEEYWEFRCGTAQLEFVYERLKVAYKYEGPLSAMAVMHYARVVGVRESA